MSDLDANNLQKVLSALLLVQLESLDEARRFPVLIRAGWSNAEIALALGLSEGAVSVRRTRLKQKIARESE